MPNRLVEERSPYLLQHAHNPVDWYPWGDPALARAREEDKPILLSIGYSACHWCHVMERESFEDDAIAALMNDAFVNVKVDREERPDLDGIYMGAVQALTGRGGWPLTVFLTPEGKAFFGGTYFPPGPRHGLPSFRQVLEAVRDAFRNRREEVEKAADQLLAALVHGTSPPSPPGPGPGQPEGVPPGEEDFFGALDRAYQVLRSRYDPVHGGFGPAPKFPQPTTLEFLLGYHRRSGDPEALEMVLHTLRQMARGGMRDHLGGGFHRYSVDARWLVPHFEKMLYDNGLLALVYLHAYRITQDPELLGVATSTLDYVLEDLTGPEGGFYAARDADSEGEEGRFYTWSPGEVDDVLGPDLGPLFRETYGVSDGGNFEGANILNLLGNPPAEKEGAPGAGGERAERLAGAKRRLKEHRSLRAPPFRDEKVLTAWNSFVLRAMAETGAVLGREDYLLAAERNADFLLGSLREDGRLLRSWKDGPGKIPGFLEDHAGLGNALLTLYEVTLEPRWLREARALLETTLDLFRDEGGSFYDAPRDGERLILRPRNPLDNATPSGNSLAVELLHRGGRIFEEPRYAAVAEGVLRSELAAVERFPSAFGRLLSTLASTLSPPVEVVVLGSPGHPEVRSMIRAAHRPFMPERLVLGGDPESLPPLPFLKGKSMRGGAPTAYLCEGFTCGPPLPSAEALGREMGTEGWP